MFTYIIIFGFWFLFASAWLALCIAKYNKWSKKRKNCTQQLSVKVVEILERKTARGGMVYKPIFMPADAAEHSVIDSAFYSSLVSFEIGETVELLVNPNNEKDFLYKDNQYNKGMIVDILCCCLPVIFVIGIILTK